nr:F-box/FBD/LRR-repeat protein At1g13570-like [Nicotiana tomentosiformis]
MTDTYKGVEDGRDKLDRLTDLPINVIHQIQEYMAVEDATRMSVLSSKWRHVWASNPKLIISVDFCIKRKQLGTLDIINRVLLQHYGPIKTFLLDISMIHPSEHSVIDLWMLHLSRNGLVELTLRCLEYLNTPYKLPSSVYGVELEHLSLSNCIFRPPCSFRGFHKLKSLTLSRVAFQLDVATSFLCVPNLKNLMFVKCIGLTHLNIYAPELLTLKVVLCDIETIKLGPFMDCRKLQCFAVISRDEVPQNGQHEAINLIKLLSSWPELRKLLLDRYFIKFLSSGNVAGLLSMTCTTSPFVITILMTKIKFAHCYAFLELSHIKKGSGEVDVNHLEGQGCSIGEFNNLQALRICFFHGSRVELLFVRLLLASAPFLREMIIEVDKKVSESFLREMIIEVDKKVSESHATKISEELMQFPRPALTQVIYHR